MRVRYELDVCADCIQAIANDDYSGMSDAEEQRVRTGIASYGRHIVASGDDLGFSHNRCECCQALAGDRFKAAVLEEGNPICSHPACPNEIGATSYCLSPSDGRVFCSESCRTEATEEES